MVAPFWDPPWEVCGQYTIVEDEDPADLAHRQVDHRNYHRVPEQKQVN